MDIPSLRSETPGTQYVTHFNNAGASLMPSVVSGTIIHYINEESRYGGYETVEKYQQELSEVYDIIASFIHAQPDEIALLENATVAWNMGFFAIDFEKGDRILTSVAEYASNYINYIKLKEERDITVEVIPSDSSGQTSVDALQDMMDEQVKLISITHMPTNGGLVNPVEDIGAVAQNYDCLYLVDACQSVGHYPVDVEAIGCDLLSATGRKYLRGPRGTGFLYVNSNILDKLNPPFLDLRAAEWIEESRYEMRADARRFENWENNYAGILGLGEAVRYAHELEIDNIWKRIISLADILRNQLRGLPGISVHDIGETQSGIVTFSSDRVTPGAIKRQLSEENVNVTTSTKSSTLLDMQQRNLDEIVRASVHYFNTEEEIGRLVSLLKSIGH